MRAIRFRASELYAQINKILAQDVPCAFLVSDGNHAAYRSPEVQGLELTIGGQMRSLVDVWLNRDDHGTGGDVDEG